jgi:adenosylhomocysteine nucleosidase
MSAPSRLIGIATALKEERDAILRGARDLRFSGGGLIRARIGGSDVVLTVTGDGAESAWRGAEALCDAVRPAALIGAGMAGALTPGLSVGDLLVALRVLDEAGDAPAPDARLVAKALAAGNALPGTLRTVARPAVSSAEKAHLAKSLGVEGVSAVDMESSAWARAAAARGVPYIVVRSISDASDEDLPEYLARCVGEDGRMRRSTVVAYAALRPRTIPALLRMRRRMARCGETLAVFLQTLLAEGL